MTLPRVWVLPVLPVLAVLLIAVALVPLAPGTGHSGAWVLAFLLLSVALAAGVAAVATRVAGGTPTGQRVTLVIATGVFTAAAPFAVALLVGGPTVVFPWLIFGLLAACWQLFLCEGAASRVLHGAIAFGYTFTFAGITLFFTLVASGLVD